MGGLNDPLHLGGIMYTVDRGFVRELKAIDKRLDCEFDNRIGKFKVTYPRVIGERIPVFWIENEEDESFRFPDRRDIARVWRSDTHRDDVRSALNGASYKLKKMEEKKKQDQREESRARTREDRRILAQKLNKLAGSGKGNSTFRRIDPKTKGVKY